MSSNATTFSLLAEDLKANEFGRRLWNEALEIHRQFKYEFAEYRNCAALCDVFERTCQRAHDFFKLLFNQKKTKEFEKEFKAKHAEYLKFKKNAKKCVIGVGEFYRRHGYFPDLVIIFT